MFNFPLILPSGRTIRVPEITNEHLFTIFKFSAAEDVVGFADYIENEVFKTVKGLNCVEKVYIILYIRILCLGPMIEMLGVEESGVAPKISIDLYNVIEKIESLPTIEEEIIEQDSFKITLGIPTKINYASPDEVIFSCIRSVTTDETKINFDDLTAEELDSIYNSLPPIFVSKLNDYLVKINNTLGELVFIKNDETLKLKEVKSGIVGNGIIAVILSLFKHDYKSFVEMIYHFINKVGGSYNDFLKLTHQDTQIMLKTYQLEMEKQNDELNKAKSGHK